MKIYQTSMCVACALCLSLVCGSLFAQDNRKAEYVHAVTRGADWLPWQDQTYPSDAEQEFRAMIEARKSELLAERGEVNHPILLTTEDLARAKKNIKETDWAASWFANVQAYADELLEQPSSWIDGMLTKNAPAHGYGFTCPKCVGKKSQEATGTSLIRWNWREPEHFSCRKCGQIYPDAAFPETARLVLPRLGYEVTYYLNDAERAAPDDRSGNLAWHWVNYPIHVSFTGIIREKKGIFMRDAARRLALAYGLTGDEAYALRAKEILLRLAECYRAWPYRDYWDTYADCDPMFAAWNDKSLPLEWKRHLSEQAYAKDTLEKAAMRQTYWGAGRFHPSTDSISGLVGSALAYDLIYNAPIWSDAERTKVERDYLLEYVLGAEPYAGGPDQANNPNNKAPRIYNAMAAVAQALGLPRMADTALRGYEVVRDESFLYDGFSTESPAYTNMYLSQLLIVPETLHGFQWPKDFKKRSGTVDLYANDPQLKRMYEAILHALRPNGRYLPLSDTRAHTKLSLNIVLMGLRRYPELYGGVLPSIYGKATGEYAVFNIPEAALREDTGLNLPEKLYPAWQTAVLRDGTNATVALPFNPKGGHRHMDNLALFYEANNQTLLGDLGYLGDMPQNKWIKSTKSHNLVVVDGENQIHAGRHPTFDTMVTSPMASMVQASSTAYPQCSAYKRRVVLVKDPCHGTFLIDVFQVEGGNEHRYRVFSELAASDAPANSALVFQGVNMPTEAPLPQVGNSLNAVDIYGLRDPRQAKPAGEAWNATWTEPTQAQRLWMLGNADRVEASNGPGQRTLNEAGRRVRYVDAVREGKNLRSLFVAVHAPSTPGTPDFALNVERVPLPDSAGENAVALRCAINGCATYYALFDAKETVEVDDIRMRGDFLLAAIKEGQLSNALASGTELVQFKDSPAIETPATWRGKITGRKIDRILVNTKKPAKFPALHEDVQSYVRVGDTGLPVSGLGQQHIEITKYPIPEGADFELPALWYK
jgi:hypothetical protein